MKLIKASYEILPQASGLNGIYKQIELAGRTCYKSEDKITKDSCKKFIDMLIKSNHYSPLEHGTVYLKVPYDDIMEYVDSQNPYDRDILCNSWTKYVIDYGNNLVYITSNYRWIIENNLDHWLKYICEPTKYHEKRVSVKFICSRAISHELVRHRVFSFCQESQRYCAYNKDKFGQEVTFIAPLFIDCDKKLMNTEIFSNTYEILETALQEAETNYFILLNEGFKAEEAREVLPNSTKTEIIMTGFMSDWIRFFKLRCDKSAHPEMRRLTNPLKKEFIKLEYIDG